MLDVEQQLLAAEKVAFGKVEEVRAALRRLRNEGDEAVRPVSATEFLLEDQEPLKWILKGLLAEESVALLVADGGKGKTTLLTQLCLCVADGRTIFEYDVVRQNPVLYVLAEGSRPAFRERVILAKRSIDVSFANLPWFIQPGDCSDYKIGSAGLEAMIEQSKAKLVVLDTLGYFHDGDENKANDWKTHVMVPLRALISKYHCSFVLVHHQTKASPDREGWQKGRGTTAMFSDCDLWMRLEGIEGQGNEWRRELFIDKNKYGSAGYSKKLAFNADGAFFRLEPRA